MDVYEKIEKLLEIKEKKLEEESDIEIINFLKQMLNDKSLFFKANAKLVIGSLLYIGIPEDEVEDVYGELISMTNYSKYVPTKRILFDVDKQLQKKEIK